jgi:hypothetical protein
MKTLLKYAFGLAFFGSLQVASANPIQIGIATLTGGQEVPPTGSTAAGSITVYIDGDILVYRFIK